MGFSRWIKTPVVSRGHYRKVIVREGSGKNSADVEEDLLQTPENLWKEMGSSTENSSLDVHNRSSSHPNIRFNFMVANAELACTIETCIIEFRKSHVKTLPGLYGPIQQMSSMYSSHSSPWASILLTL